MVLSLLRQYLHHENKATHNKIYHRHTFSLIKFTFFFLNTEISCFHQKTTTTHTGRQSCKGMKISDDCELSAHCIVIM